MKHSLSILALAASLTLVPAAAQAQADPIRAVASGQLEAPPNESPGSSVATFEFDSNILRAEVPFRDLLAGTTVAHIHCCTSDAFTGVAPPAIMLLGFPLGVRGGTYTIRFRAGEIRGWLVAAPIPDSATWGMLGFGLAGLGMVARRRARMEPVRSAT